MIKEILLHPPFDSCKKIVFYISFCGAFGWEEIGVCWALRDLRWWVFGSRPILMHPLRPYFELFF